MEKLTDNEIVKALEYCAGSVVNECRDCPFYKQCENDEQLVKYTLDLINRKDAEIEKLNVELVGMRGACESYKIHYDNAQAEIERLNNELISADEVIGFREAEIERLQEVTTNTVNSSIRFGLDKEQEIRKAKSEAYKEFYERLQNMSDFLAEDDKYIGYSEAVRMNHIDNLYKELTEGGNEPPKNDFKE